LGLEMYIDFGLPKVLYHIHFFAGDLPFHLNTFATEWLPSLPAPKYRGQPSVSYHALNFDLSNQRKRFRFSLFLFVVDSFLGFKKLIQDMPLLLFRSPPYSQLHIKFITDQVHQVISKLIVVSKLPNVLPKLSVTPFK
jgi:hypothetical protein